MLIQLSSSVTFKAYILSSKITFIDGWYIVNFANVRKYLRRYSISQIVCYSIISAQFPYELIRFEGNYRQIFFFLST